MHGCAAPGDESFFEGLGRWPAPTSRQPPSRVSFGGMAGWVAVYVGYVCVYVPRH